MPLGIWTAARSTIPKPYGLRLPHTNKMISGPTGEPVREEFAGGSGGVLTVRNE
jgi:hypothetical protein